MKLTLSAVFRKEAVGGYSALCPELGVASQGETIEEAGANLKEACELFIESAKHLGILEDLGIGNKALPTVLTGSISADVKL